VNWAITDGKWQHQPFLFETPGNEVSHLWFQTHSPIIRLDSLPADIGVSIGGNVTIRLTPYMYLHILLILLGTCWSSKMVSSWCLMFWRIQQMNMVDGKYIKRF
jgi:hypothetical protein